MKHHTIGILSALLAIAAPGAQPSSVLAKTAPRKAAAKAPKSKLFTVLYEWRTGTVAPPYYHEYSIALSSGGRGYMTLTTGYGSRGDSKSPQWTEAFAVSPAALAKLRATMRARGVFTRDWREPSAMERPVGGGSENLGVQANGRGFRIPAFLATNAERADAAAVYAAINALVPAAARARLEARQKRYEQQNGG